MIQQLSHLIIKENLRMVDKTLPDFWKSFYEILRLRSFRTAHFVARGCRPFSTEKEPLALSPGVSNPRITFYAEKE